ncbi:unnamed protein product [Linum trigynum]|uniref:Uncharacterized protein n=1 Tax=Linum trigynum TaxID=586398 RepID=A0AAV2EIY6_9ROSI
MPWGGTTGGGDGAPEGRCGSWWKKEEARRQSRRGKRPESKKATERGPVKLEHSCRKRVNRTEIEAKPNWSFESLLSEVDSLEEKLSWMPNFSVPY